MTLTVYDKEKVYRPLTFQPVLKATIEITFETMQDIRAMEFMSPKEGYAILGKALIDQLTNKTD